ncbi:hypothetical protein CK203_018938 [Vitis vinifera]|uniref:Uncharacterized protein n=1 Tax=Vitis vinifera TaxID=29760 RepID=A0A438IR11_VITVI|nr:hypothetical protein CK203_018938 [Vitis vinifera]
MRSTPPPDPPRQFHSCYVDLPLLAVDISSSVHLQETDWGKFGKEEGGGIIKESKEKHGIGLWEAIREVANFGMGWALRAIGLSLVHSFLQLTDHSDKLTWRLAKNGKFSVKSFCNFLRLREQGNFGGEVVRGCGELFLCV